MQKAISIQVSNFVIDKFIAKCEEFNLVYRIIENDKESKIVRVVVVNPLVAFDLGAYHGELRMRYEKLQ